MRREWHPAKIAPNQYFSKYHFAHRHVNALELAMHVFKKHLFKVPTVYHVSTITKQPFYSHYNNNNNKITFVWRRKVPRYRGAGGIRLRLSERVGLEVSFESVHNTAGSNVRW